MKPLPALFLILLLSSLIGLAAEANAAENPVELPPYSIEERPFGFLGIKHATVSINALKFVVGMKSIKFLQIDELEPNSPGIAAGVLPGDRIASIDGVPITQFGVRKLRRMNTDLTVGQKLKVEVVRPSDNSIRTLEITVPPRTK